MKDLNEKIVAFRIKADQLDLIDEYSKKMRINRSQLIRNFIESGLNDVKLLEKVGLLALAIKGRDVLSIVRTSIGEDRYEVKNDKIVIDL